MSLSDSDLHVEAPAEQEAHSAPSLAVEVQEANGARVKSPEAKKAKNEGAEPETVPPRHFEVDADELFEMLERKNVATLEKKFRGVSGLVDVLGSHPERGIDASSIERRREQFGANELWQKDPVTFLEFLIEAFSDGIIQMLCVAAVLSIIFGLTLPSPHSGKIDRETGWIEGFAIIISVSVVTLMGSINNYQKAKRFEEMEQEQAVLEVQVVRGGEEITIKNTELVVGDVMVVESGILLSCDYVMIAGSDLKCNESAMTGEADIIDKSADQDPFFLSGTQIEEGSGRLMVIGVGMNSYQGRMKQTMDDEVADTPLQEHLSVLADDIGKLGFIGAFLLVTALYIKEGVEIANGKEARATSFLNYVILAITIIVVAIPEGLPLAVTISLAFSMKSMMKDNCMVRVLSSCETMGAATAICSDKTGTLTTNEMTVVQGLIAEEEFVVTGYGVQAATKLAQEVNRNVLATELRGDASLLDRFCFAVAINSTAREQVIDGKLTWVGNKTEHGLLGFVNAVGRSYKDMRASVPEGSQRQFPFNSKKKRMTTVVKDDFGAVTTYCKGASELVLESCDRYLAKDGSVMRLTDEKRDQLLEIINNMASQGNRTIGIAFHDLENGISFPDQESEDEMVFMGVLGIQDPIREEVPQAVLNCQSAGVVVRMVTGDNINTAIAIAKKCNILRDDRWDHAITGEEFRRLYETDEAHLKKLLPRLRVIARSSPQDKYCLVNALQEIGEVVGVTGDGTNDAPALKLANVGFAMHAGTDIAKGNSDMILLDNNFASVVNAIRWGRAVNDNIRKFLQYQLSINIAGCVLTIVGSLASPTSKEPFAPVQLLWLNLIMDTMAALALATERPDEASLQRLPVFKQAALISRQMWTFILIHAAYQTVMTLLLLFLGHDWLDTVEERDLCNREHPSTLEARNITTIGGHRETVIVEVENPNAIFCTQECEFEGGQLRGFRCQQGRVHSTIIFNTFIWFQIFNMFNARKLFHEWNPFEGLFSRSQLLCGVWFVIMGFQVFAVEVGGRFLSTIGLSWEYWLVCIGLGAGELLVGAIVRLLPIENKIPTEILEKWERESRLRESLGVHSGLPEDHHSTTLFIKKDPALRRGSTMVVRK